MRLPTGEELVTLKDLTAWVSLGQSEAAMAKTMRQIRHWTQNDLLQTYGGKATGKGIPRFYLEEPTLQIAGVLVELSRYITSLAVLKPVADELYDGFENGMPYLFTALTDENTFLQVSWDTDPETGEVEGASIHQWDRFDADDGDDEPDPGPSSSVLINVTEVSARIYGNKYRDPGAARDE